MNRDEVLASCDLKILRSMLRLAWDNLDHANNREMQHVSQIIELLKEIETLKTKNKMENFEKYRRKQISELRPVTDAELMSMSLDQKISVSQADKEAGSPAIGDMVARNPKNHDDQWLVAKQYFEDNFETVDLLSKKPSVSDEEIEKEAERVYSKAFQMNVRFNTGFQVGAKWALSLSPQVVQSEVSEVQPHPEDFCQQCKNPNPVWYAPNDLFNKVNGSPNGIICPVCFQNKANDLGINLIFTTEILPNKNK